MKKLLKNVTLISTTNQFEPADVLIENDMIMQIGCSLQEEHAYVIEGGGRLLVPGFIDIHSHLREPGGEQKETIQTGTKAAARGGFTTVCAMPNTNPVPDHVATVQALFKKIEDKAVVRVLPYAAITEKLQGEQLVDIDQLAQTNIFAFTDDGVGVQRSGMMYQAMKQAAHCDLPVVAHCEDNSLIFGGAVHLGNVSQRLEIPGIPSVAESVQIARDVLLAEATGCHYHVCHVSTKESVRVIRDAKRAGIHVTAEVTPHHLLLNENDVKENDTHFKMNPPLRSKEDQKALLEGLLDGTIDLIATDHAPHTEEEKSVAMEHAPFGIVGFETAFPLLYSYLVKTHKVTLNQLVDWLTIKPAMAFKLPFGRLETNLLADLTLIDLEKETIINREYLLSKGKNTPFHGWKIQGIPVLTMSEGKIVYEEGSND